MARRTHRAPNPQEGFLSSLPIASTVLAGALCILFCRLAERCSRSEQKPQQTVTTHRSELKQTTRPDAKLPSKGKPSRADGHSHGHEHAEEDAEMQELEQELKGIEAEIESLEHLLAEEAAGTHDHSHGAQAAGRPAAAAGSSGAASSGGARKPAQVAVASSWQAAGKQKAGPAAPKGQASAPNQQRPASGAASSQQGEALARGFLSSKFADSYLRHRGVKNEE